jgi:hypothetical protein
MASVIYNEFKRASAAGEIDLDTGGDDIRAILVMTNTTADTENSAMVYVGDLTTLDECDATGYSRQALAGEVVNKDDPNSRAEFDANNISFSGLGGDATRGYQGVVLYKHVTNDADSPLVAFIEFDNQPLSKEATQIDVPWNAEGILQLT